MIDMFCRHSGFRGAIIVDGVGEGSHLGQVVITVPKSVLIVEVGLRHELCGEFTAFSVRDLEHTGEGCFERTTFGSLVDWSHTSLALGYIHLTEVAFADL